VRIKVPMKNNSETFRKQVRLGKESCPICGQNCAKIIYTLKEELLRLQDVLCEEDVESIDNCLETIKQYIDK